MEGIRDAAADILPAGGQAWLLGQDHPTEDRPVQVGGSCPHSSTGRGGYGHDLLGARLRGDAVQGRIDGRGFAVVLREDGDGGYVRQGHKHPPGDGIRDHRHRVRRQARAAESIRRHTRPSLPVPPAEDREEVPDRQAEDGGRTRAQEAVGHARQDRQGVVRGGFRGMARQVGQVPQRKDGGVGYGEVPLHAQAAAQRLPEHQEQPAVLVHVVRPHGQRHPQHDQHHRCALLAAQVEAAVPQRAVAQAQAEIRR